MSLRFRLRSLPFLLALAVGFARPASAKVNPDWVTPLPPFKIADNLYYVGGRDLAAYLITTPDGDILLNANYITSAPQIRHSVEALGFHWGDIKILLISHAHVDHAGAAAAILKSTGAHFEVMDGDVDVMESGGKTDFAFGGPGKPAQFPAAHVDHVLHNGEEVTLGGITLVAHKTPGHTRGCTTWTMRTHVPGEPAGTLRNVVITGSWSVLSEYRLLGTHGGRQASYPGIANDYTITFATLHQLPCDIFLGSHGSFFGLLSKVKRMPTEGDRAWIDPNGYQEAVAQGQHAFEVAYRRESEAAQHGGQ